MWKKGFRIGFLFIHFLLISCFSYSQNLLTDRLEAIMEDISVNNPVNTVDWEELLIRWEEIARDPFDLNRITQEQLETFPFLSDRQIENILAYVYLKGPVESVYELQLIPEIDRKTIRYLEPFVCVKPVDNSRSFRWKNIWKYGKHELVGRCDLPFYTREGYKDCYLGPKPYVSGKYAFNYRDNLYFGVNGEKDAGEPFGALHNKKGFDYYSYYLLISGIGRVQKLALGNYRLGFGQGLVINTDFLQGKSSYMGSFDFRSSGIRKHSSNDEYHYFRGAAAEVKLTKTTHLALFYSHRNLDGVLDSQGNIQSIYTTGLHRSASEAAKIHQLTQQMAGGHVTFTRGRLKLGMTGIYYFFNRPYQPLETSYSQFDIRGNHFYNVGVDYNFRWKGLALQGEVAKSKQGWASLNKIQYTFPQGYQLSLIHRYYASDYWGWYARSFSEGSKIQNENGWFFSAEMTPLHHWRFFVYGDFFSFPWKKYRISKPSWGTDVLAQADYSPSDTYTLSGYYRFKRKERDEAGNHGNDIRPYFQHRIRIRSSWQPVDWLLWKSSFYYTRFQRKETAGSNGFYIGQTVAVQPVSFPLKGELQAGFFHTDDYDTRVYASEKGMLYSFYTPSFQGRGLRLTAHVRYRLNAHFLFLLKYGETLYFDRNSIGSGHDQILSRHKGDMQLQLRINF